MTIATVAMVRLSNKVKMTKLLAEYCTEYRKRNKESMTVEDFNKFHEFSCFLEPLVEFKELAEVK